MKKNNPAGKGIISRRIFLNQAVTGTAMVAMSPGISLLPPWKSGGSGWPTDASSFRFHMIGHAHIDPVWLWPWNEGLSVVMSTFRSALDRMNENPDFIFTASSAQFYRWVEENDSAMLAEIRKRVEEGRWNIVGGWWIEPDVNIPSGEALVRQGLYGQMTFERLFGRRAKVAANPDSFGHAGTLPQILKLQGLDNYIFMRPAPHEKQLPSDIFWWEAPDGSRVLTYRIQISYNDEGPVKERIEKILAYGRNQTVKSFMAYYGAGDHGGGATKENIRSIDSIRNDKTAPVVFYSTPENYFSEIRADNSLKLPVVRDDLQHHAVGCYTAGSAIKKGNREAEHALVRAEKTASVGSFAWGAVYPKAELTAAWERVLFLQFHDSLAGTSLYEHYKTAAEGHGFALSIADQTVSTALQKLEWQIPSEDPSCDYLVVFNPHPREVNGLIEYDLGWDASYRSSSVEDDRHELLPHQWTSGSSEAGGRKKLLAKVAVPPFGYRQLRITENGSGFPGNPVKAGERTLENEYVRLRFADNGTVSLFDIRNDREIFSGGMTGCRAVVIDDPSDTWSHDVRSFPNEIGEFGNAVIKITENGPLRATIRTKTTYNASSLVIDWLICAGSPNIEARVTLDWHEHLKMLKFSFPVDVDSPEITYEIPYGHILKEANGDENPGQRWIDITGTSGGKQYGLTVINEAKYGYSAQGNDLRVSVARSAVYAHHKPRVLDMNAEHLWMDQGIQSFRMLLIPHSGTWKEINVPAITEEFMSPLMAVYQGIHPGTMPLAESFLSSDAPAIAITAMKLSEKGDDLIIRCVETLGAKTHASIGLHFAGKKWTGEFRPCEIKTLRFNKAGGEIREVSLLEE